jgi:DNA-binding response OmpR family regulator
MDLRGKKILIVDDEEDLCEILQYNLGNAGYILKLHIQLKKLSKKI